MIYSIQVDEIIRFCERHELIAAIQATIPTKEKKKINLPDRGEMIQNFDATLAARPKVFDADTYELMRALGLR